VLLPYPLNDLLRLDLRPSLATNANAAGDDNLAIVTTHRIITSS
jgi:hypothetical protein